MVGGHHRWRTRAVAPAGYVLPPTTVKRRQHDGIRLVPAWCGIETWDWVGCSAHKRVAVHPTQAVPTVFTVVPVARHVVALPPQWPGPGSSITDSGPKLARSVLLMR